jgi:hypothetical protein
MHQQTRTYCRRCRSKLPAPVTNMREAFCARGCHTSFYRHRCMACERPMERKAEHQKLARQAANRWNEIASELESRRTS